MSEDGKRLPDIKLNISADTKDMAPVVQNFIEKISSAVGDWWSPIGKKREAQSMIDVVDMLGALDEGKLSPLQQRAISRWLGEETINQRNMEKVTADAIPLLNEGARAEEMDEEWLRVFFDKAKFISDDEVRLMWSRILAGEANSPGSFSKRALSVLHGLGKDDAEIFVKLCCYVVRFSEGSCEPVIFDHKDAIYKGLSFVQLQQIADAGLISRSSVGYILENEHDNFSISYDGKELQFKQKEGKDRNLQIGNYLLTNVGKQLYFALEPDSVSDFLEYLIKKWAENYDVDK